MLESGAELRRERDADPYSLFYLYKFQITLFHYALFLAMAETIMFWEAFFDRHREIWSGKLELISFETYKTLFLNGMMCHSVPLICLLTDFSFNCIPIVWRHNIIFLTLTFSYGICIAFFGHLKGIVYEEFDPHTKVGLVHIGFFFVMLMGCQWLIVCWY